MEGRSAGGLSTVKIPVCLFTSSQSCITLRHLQTCVCAWTICVCVWGHLCVRPWREWMGPHLSPCSPGAGWKAGWGEKSKCARWPWLNNQSSNPVRLSKCVCECVSRFYQCRLVLLDRGLIVKVPDEWRTSRSHANTQTHVHTRTTLCIHLIHSSLSCSRTPLSNSHGGAEEKWIGGKSFELCDTPHKQHSGCWEAWDEGMLEIMWEDKLQREGISWRWISRTQYVRERETTVQPESEKKGLIAMLGNCILTEKVTKLSILQDVSMHECAWF